MVDFLDRWEHWVLGPTFLLLGVVLAAVNGRHLATVPWDLDADGPITTSVAGSRSAITGDRYTIEVAGVRYTCSGGDRKLAHHPVEVVYDPRDPSRCRERATAGAPGVFELRSLLFSLGALLFGAASTLGLASWLKIRRDLAGSSDTPVRLPHFRRTRIALYFLAVVLILGSSLWWALG